MCRRLRQCCSQLSWNSFGKCCVYWCEKKSANWKGSRYVPRHMIPPASPISPSIKSVRSVNYFRLPIYHLRLDKARQTKAVQNPVEGLFSLERHSATITARRTAERMTGSVATCREDRAGLLHAGPTREDRTGSLRHPVRGDSTGALPPVRGDQAGLLHAGPTRED